MIWRMKTARRIAKEKGATWIMSLLPVRGRTIEYWDIPKKYKCNKMKKALEELYPFDVPVGYQREKCL